MIQPGWFTPSLYHFMEWHDQRKGWLAQRSAVHL